MLASMLVMYKFSITLIHVTTHLNGPGRTLGVAIVFFFNNGLLNNFFDNDRYIFNFFFLNFVSGVNLICFRASQWLIATCLTLAYSH